MNNVSSFYDSSSERLSMPVLTTSLSFDSLIIQEDDDDSDLHIFPRTHGDSGEFEDDGHPLSKSPYNPCRPDVEPDEEEDEEIKQIRTANLLQRTLFTELEKLKHNDAETSEHPLLQGEVRCEDSELLVTGELKGKSISVTGGTGLPSSSASSSIASIISGVMTETAFDTWQEGFSLYLQKRQQQQQSEEQNEHENETGGVESHHSLHESPITAKTAAAAIARRAISDSSRKSEASGRSPPGGTSSSLEKKSSKGGFLFGNVDWSAARTGSDGSSGGPNCNSELFTIKEVLTPTKNSPTQSPWPSNWLGDEPEFRAPLTRRDSDVRKAFTGFHNNASTENVSPFLGEDNSSHGGNAFTPEMFSDYQQNLEKNFKSGTESSVDSPELSAGGSALGGDDNRGLLKDFDEEVIRPDSRAPMAHREATVQSSSSTSTQEHLTVTATSRPPTSDSSHISGLTSGTNTTKTPAALTHPPTTTPSPVHQLSPPTRHTPKTPPLHTTVLRNSSEPCFLPMPGGRSIFYSSDNACPSPSCTCSYRSAGHSTGKSKGMQHKPECATRCSNKEPDMSAILQSIPLDAWITPYIITASLLLGDRKLCDKNLTDISFQQDVSVPVPPSASSAGSRGSSLDLEGRSRSNSDLMTVTEDVTLTDFGPSALSHSPLSISPSSLPLSRHSPRDHDFDPGYGLDLDSEDCLQAARSRSTEQSDGTPPSSNSNSLLVNPFKFLNPFRGKNKGSGGNVDEEAHGVEQGSKEGVMKATKAVRRRSHGDVLAHAQGSGGSASGGVATGGGGMRRVTSHADVPQSVASGGGGDGTDTTKPKLTLGQRLGMGNRSTDALNTEQTVYGDLLVSHDEHGVYLSSSQPSDTVTSDISLSPVPFAANNHSSSSKPESGLRKAFASAAAAAMSSSSGPFATSGAVPSFISGLFRHPDCTDLGRVLIGRESPAGSFDESTPSIVWEARRCFLWDNYVFELLVPSTHDLLGGLEGRPIGYLNLSGALLETIESDSSTNEDTSERKPSIDFTPSANTIHSVRHKGGLRDTGDTEDSAPSIVLRYFPTASPTALRRRVVLRRSTRRGTLKLMQQLITASRCTVQDLYEYNKINETKPDLGTGRYSKCFKAINKRTRRRVLGDGDSSGDEGSVGAEQSEEEEEDHEKDDQRDSEDDDSDGDNEGAEEKDKDASSTSTSIKGRIWKRAFRKKKKKSKKKKKKKKKKSKFSLMQKMNPLSSQAGDGGGRESGHSLASLSGDAGDRDKQGSGTEETGLDEHGNHIHDGLCALKLVDKRQYWDRVRMGKERGDSLSREILAQAHLLNTVIAASQSNIPPTLSSSPPIMNSEDDRRPHADDRHIELPVVQLYGIFETREHFVMEMELMQSLDLSEKLNEQGEFAEEQAKHIAIQLVQAVALCQVNGMAHRDIKLTNIGFPVRTNTALLAHDTHASASTAAAMQVKLADFGMAGFVEKDGKLRGRCGTPGYVAPEILKSGKHEGYGIGVDLFSVGCVVYTLLCGYEPFFGETDAELIAANKSGDYTFPLPEWAPNRVSEDARDFVGRLLDPFPTRRLTVHEALDHPWMAVYGGQGTLTYPPKFVPDSQSSCVVS